MPPRGKRKAAKENQTTKKARVENRKISEANHKIDEMTKPFSVKKCKLWFEEYADEPDLIGPEGMQKLCKDLHLDPEDIVMLVVAWKLNAENLGFFKFSEWCAGMGSMGLPRLKIFQFVIRIILSTLAFAWTLEQCDSTKKLQSKLKSLKNLIDDPVIFKKMYRFAFDFCRNKDQRGLEIDVAMEMLKILLNGSWTLLHSFIEFIEQSDYKVINKDQWCNVLEFCRTVKPDLSNYDVDGAWPVMLDEFVEWLNNHQKT